jgi:DNA repair protein RadC
MEEWKDESASALSPSIQPSILPSPKVSTNFCENLKHAQEEMRIVLLDTRNNVRKIEIVSKGTLDSSLVHARDVFREAIKSNAKSIILVHNHPSGSAKPSSDDCNITKKLVEAGKVIGIEITDHVIIAGEDYFSFKEGGML